MPQARLELTSTGSTSSTNSGISTRLVFNQHERVAAWVINRVGHLIAPPYVGIGAEINGRLCGGAIFNDWNGSNINMTVAADRIGLHGILTRENVGTIYRYVFVQSKANRMTIYTRRSNKAVRKIATRYGFIFEYTAPKFFGPDRKDDAFIYALFPERAERFMQ